MGIELFVRSLLITLPIAVFTAGAGLCLLILYFRNRERLLRQDARSALELEQQKFANQRELELLRDKNERQRIRDEHNRKMAMVMRNERIQAYVHIWKIIADIPQTRAELKPESAKAMAARIRAWRLDKGGLLSDDLTRDVVLATQQALSEYANSEQAFTLVRRMRRLLRFTLRVDLGLGESGGVLGEALDKEREMITAELDEAKRLLVSSAMG
jgi:hypothetical protein